MAQAKKALGSNRKKQARAAAQPRTTPKTYPNYIGGEWVASQSGEWFENTNPADTRDVVGRFPVSNAEDVGRAVEAARAAFDRWRRTPAPRTSANTDDEGGGKKGVLPATPKNTSATGDRPTLGLTLSELTPQIANERNLKGVRGLFVQDVDQAGIAFDAGVQKFMVIQRINRQPVNTIEDFERVINALKPGDPIVLHVSAYNGEKVTQQIVQFTFQ